ncbi:MAG: cobalamin biosynthesis protein P47K [Phycisphaera sp.]|nr:cobalamin biosynthesis protein P47K [Phycisphaera sp.]
MTQPARYIMIGGFLGAGKSTAVLRLAEHLTQRGQRVGLITNDQSVGLVDTALMKSHGFDVEEIAGGCFCCRFDSLVEAADKLAAGDASPDVFIAEPVGSCTDLVATVSYPLRRIYGERYAIAPLSVLVDPLRCERVLGLDTGKSFSEKVVYVYRKQLEEASIIVIHKSDTLDEQRRLRLSNALRAEYPNATVLLASSRSGENLTEWFDLITATALPETDAMPIDYDTYAEGEALLGWLNATVRVKSPDPIDGEVVMMDLADRIRADLAEAGAEIAHLKMTMTPDHHDGRIATLNCVGGDYVPELSQSLAEKMRAGDLIVNLRAEADPDFLDTVVRRALQCEPSGTGTPGAITLEVTHAEHFRPGRPTPTWRMTDAKTLTPFSDES